MDRGAGRSQLELITSRLLQGDFDSARLAAQERASTPTVAEDLAHLRQRLDQLEETRRPDGRLRSDARPEDVFDTAVQLVLSLGAVAEAERLVCEALAIWPLDSYLNGALGLVRRAQGRLTDARERSAAAAAEARNQIWQPRVPQSTVRRCELLLDWDAQMRALDGDLSAIGEFAHFRERLAREFSRRPQYPAAPPLIDAPQLGRADRYDQVAVIEHFGLGDRVMYSRWYRALADRMPATRITVICHPLLTGLYEASFAGMPTLSFVPVDGSPPADRFDAQIPAPYLPHHLGLLTLADVRVGSSSWIMPSPAAVGRMRRALKRLRLQGPTAGIVWRDSLRWYQPHRFLPLTDLALPLASRGYALVAMDPLVDHDEVAAFTEECGVPIVTVDDLSLGDVEDVAALMVSLDRTITIDKVFANLGGALGLPTDVFLSTFVDYRWTTGPGGSPFYESVTCNRQRSYGNWAEPLEQLASTL